VMMIHNDPKARFKLVRSGYDGKIHSGFIPLPFGYLYYGTGTPEGAVTAPVGSLYFRTDGGAGTTLYIKESGAGNTGWVAVSSGASDHGTLAGLADDDHTQYALLAGRVGVHTITGGTAANDRLTLTGTNHATKGPVVFENAGMMLPLVTIDNGDSPYSVPGGVTTIRVDLSGGNVTIDLPQAGPNAGRLLFIKIVDVGGCGSTLTINPDGSETIDGAATETSSVAFEAFTIQSDGATDWMIL
jgi:hypothetical protein